MIALSDYWCDRVQDCAVECGGKDLWGSGVVELFVDLPDGSEF